MKRTSKETQDHVDKVITQWEKARPELDIYPMAFFGRLARVAKMAGLSIQSTIKEYQLQPSEFDILATIRRSHHEMTPSELCKSVMLTSGALTTRLDKLERKSLISRKLSNRDRRSFVIELTKEGDKLIDEAVNAHMENEKQLVLPLSPEEVETLNQLMKKWLLHHE